MSIKSMDWVDGSSVVAWDLDDGSCIRKQYKFPIGSACILIDRSGVAVVEPHEEVGKNNAVIFNEDGRK